MSSSSSLLTQRHTNPPDSTQFGVLNPGYKKPSGSVSASASTTASVSHSYSHSYSHSFSASHSFGYYPVSGHYTTEVVQTYETYCPSPTVVPIGGKNYTVTAVSGAAFST